ncbi:MAG: TonB-dependent receptor [Myxococcales bacterium]|nr:TonB-dependent receptor [Myxococcales bacterium]
MAHLRRALCFVFVCALASPAAAQEGARTFTDEEKAEQAPEPVEAVLTRPPELLKFAEATYPEAAREAGREAAVQLILTLSAEGKVTEAVLAGEPVGDGFDEAAIEAALQLEWRPAEVNGAPAEVRVPFIYRFAFVPDPEEPPPAEVKTARIIGRVREKGTRLPLPAVPVSLGTIAEVLSDETGRFVLENAPVGEFELVAVSPDHRRERLPVTLVAGEEVEVELLLERLRSSPFETIVRGDRERSSLTRRTLEDEELKTVPGSFGDPLRAVLNMPGMARSPYILGLVLVRGSAPSDSAILVDGHEVPIIYHFLGGPSVLPADMLERIDFYPGNFSARFGRALGGIIDVGTRRPNPKAWRGNAHFDLFDAGLYFEGPIIEDRLAISGSIRRSYVDAVIQTVVEVLADGENVSVVLPVYYDYQTRLDFRPSHAHSLSLVVFGSDDQLEVVGSQSGGTDVRLDAGIAFTRVKLDWHAQPAKWLEWTLSPVVGFDETSYRVGTLEAEGTLYEYALRFDLRAQPVENLILRTGFDGMARTLVAKGRVPVLLPEYRPHPSSTIGDREAATIERSLDLMTGAFYLEAEWRPMGGPVTVLPGVRTDQYTWVDRYRFFVDPRLNVRWAVTDDITLSAGGGLFSQPPVEWRLDPEFGNPELEPEWAVHTGLGVAWKMAEALSLSVDGFYIERYDLSERTNEAEFDENGNVADISRWENIGRGRAYGVEVLLKHELTRQFYGWISYTLSRSEQIFQIGDDWSPTDFDQTHILVLVASYAFSDNWRAGLRFRLVSCNPQTPVESPTLDSDRGTHQPLFGPPLSARGPLFNQLDIRVDRSWTFDWWSLGVYLDLQNVYNAVNPEAVQYNYRYDHEAPIPGLPVLPSFGIQGSF